MTFEGLADQLIGPSLKQDAQAQAEVIEQGFGRSIDRPFIEAAEGQAGMRPGTGVWPIN